MGNAPFSKPVFLKLHSTGNFQARNAWEAMEYLDAYWPGAHTSHYRHAARMCRAAIDGLVGAESARLAVIDAAQRAGVLAQKWVVEGTPVNTSYVATQAPEVAEAAQ